MANKLDKSVVITIIGKKNFREGSDVIDSLPLVDIINWTDKDGNIRERRIRYIPGSTSIFADEQPDSYDLKWESTRMRPRTLRVINGAKTIGSHETLLLDFIRNCNYNISNPSRKDGSSGLFEVYDPEANAKKANNARDLRVEAEGKVKTMSESRLRAHVIILSTDGTLDNYRKYRSMEIEQLRDVAYQMAAYDPKKFLDTLTSPQTTNRYTVINAILRDIISYDESTQVLKWKNGDTLQLPSNGMNAIDALSELSVTSTHHKSIVESLTTQLASVLSSEEKKVASNVVAPSDVKKDIYDTLIDQCVDAGIMSVNGIWFMVNNASTDPAEKKPFKVNGKRNFIEALKSDNRKLYVELLDRLESVKV
jgi:hypothetical protein